MMGSCSQPSVTSTHRDTFPDVKPLSPSRISCQTLNVQIQSFARGIFTRRVPLEDDGISKAKVIVYKEW
jgi:hypothetical protein